MQQKSSTEHLIDLLNGSPISKVPREIHPNLLLPLSLAKNEAMAKANYKQVRQIDSIVKRLQIYPKKTVPQLKRSKSLNASDPDEIIDQLLRGEMTTSQIKPNLLQPVYDNIRTRIPKEKSAKRYHEAQLLFDCEQEIKKIFEKKSKSPSSQTKTERARNIIQIEKNKQQKLNEDYQEKKKNLLEIHEEELKKLKEQQQNELTNFDLKANKLSEGKFRKFSTGTRGLRAQENYLVNAQRYNEAIPIKELADSLENEEENQQKISYSNSIKLRREAMIQNHNNQLYGFEQLWKRRFEELDKRKEEIEEPIQKRISFWEQYDKNPDYGLPQLKPASPAVYYQEGSALEIQPEVISYE